METDSKHTEVQLSQFSARNWKEMKNLLTGTEYRWKEHVLKRETLLKPKLWQRIQVTASPAPYIAPLVEIKSVLLTSVLLVAFVIVGLFAILWSAL
jgi:hypothetical protein